MRNGHRPFASPVLGPLAPAILGGAWRDFTAWFRRCAHEHEHERPPPARNRAAADDDEAEEPQAAAATSEAAPEAPEDVPGLSFTNAWARKERAALARGERPVVWTSWFDRFVYEEVCDVNVNVNVNVA